MTAAPEELMKPGSVWPEGVTWQFRITSSCSVFLNIEQDRNKTLVSPRFLWMACRKTHTYTLGVCLTDSCFCCRSGLRTHGRGPGTALQSGEHARAGLGAEEEPLQGRTGAKMADTWEGTTLLCSVSALTFAVTWLLMDFQPIQITLKVKDNKCDVY